MEVMSSLLLCALVGLLPQTLGSRDHSFSYNLNKTMPFINKFVKVNPIGLLKLNAQWDQRHDNTYIDCTKCQECMGNAIKHIQRNFLDTNDNQLNNRVERDSQIDTYSEALSAEFTLKDKPNKHEEETVQKKRRKHRKKRGHVSLSITKYVSAGEVYALKVKKSKGKDDDMITCQVFRVVSSHPCGTAEGHNNISRKQYRADTDINNSVKDKWEGEDNNEYKREENNEYKKKENKEYKREENIENKKVDIREDKRDKNREDKKENDVYEKSEKLPNRSIIKFNRYNSFANTNLHHMAKFLADTRILEENLKSKAQDNKKMNKNKKNEDIDFKDIYFRHNDDKTRSIRSMVDCTQSTRTGGHETDEVFYYKYK